MAQRTQEGAKAELGRRAQFEGRVKGMEYSYRPCKVIWHRSTVARYVTITVHSQDYMYVEVNMSQSVLSRLYRLHLYKLTIITSSRPAQRLQVELRAWSVILIATQHTVHCTQFDPRVGIASANFDMVAFDMV